VRCTFNLPIFRDISLENFVIDEKGNPVLIDFGMCLKMPTEEVLVDGARLVRRQIFPFKPQGRCGKNNYMSPEIYKNLSFFGEAIDVWALGVILFMFVTGHPPYKFAHSADMNFDRTVKKLKSYVESFHVKMSLEAFDLLNGMLQEDAKKRWSMEKILAHPCLTNQAPFFQHG
jgi:serine/threonine protein kinase